MHVYVSMYLLFVYLLSSNNNIHPKIRYFSVCDGALLPRLGENGKELEICPECKCKHEARNTTLIKVSKN